MSINHGSVTEAIQQALPSRHHVVTHISIVVPDILLVTGLIMCYGGAILPGVSSHSQLVVGTIWRHQQEEDIGQGKLIATTSIVTYLYHM